MRTVFDLKTVFDSTPSPQLIARTSAPDRKKFTPMFRILLTIIATLSIILAAGWLALRRSDIPFEQLDSIYTSSGSRFLDLGGEVRIHFRDAGPRDAPVIVLVHGFSASLHTWEPWVDGLKKDYRVITLDLPGHGLSGCIDNDAIGTTQFVETIDRVTRALDVDRFVLAGNSMGGGAAWNYALTYPERVSGLVLIDAAGWPPEGEQAQARPLAFRLLDYKLTRQVMAGLDLSALIRSGLRDSFADPALVTDEMVDRYSALSRAPCHREAMAVLSSGEGRVPATQERLAAITAPTLVMHGEEDRVIPVAHGVKFSEAIRGADLKIYQGVGHLPQEEIPEVSLNDLRAFITDRVIAERVLEPVE